MKSLPLALLLPPVLAALPLSSVHAVNVAWTNAATGLWNVGTNWDLGAPPTSADTPLVNNGGTASIDNTMTITVGLAQVGGGTGTTGFLDVSGGSLTVTSDLRIGGNALNGTGTLIMSAGTVTMNPGNFNIGFGSSGGSGATGTVNLSGGTVTVRNAAAIVAVGNRGTGTVNQTGGEVFTVSTGTTPGVINLGRNSTTAVGNGTYNLSGGLVATAELRFGNAIIGGATNTFNLSGTGSLMAGSLNITNSAAANSFQFTGGSLSTNAVNMPLTNNGGTLRTGAFNFNAGTAAGVQVNPIGSILFGNNVSYIQKSGTLAIDIDGPSSNDILSAGVGTSTGSAVIGGTIAVTLLNGYNPAVGTTFDIVTADTVVPGATVTGTTPSGHIFTSSKVTAGDGREVLRLTVALDSDNDLMPDNWETANALNPALNDAALDPDNDFTTNRQEYERSTDPHDNDTDNDGLVDGHETMTGLWVSVTNTGTHPLLADTDGDGLPDGLENPDLPYTGPTQPGTDPNRANTDGDAFNDGEEIAGGSNPQDLNSTPNPAAGSVLALDFNSTSNVVQPGFTGMDPTSGWTGTFGAVGVTITPVGCTIDHRDRAAAGGGGGFNPLFADFIFANLSDQDGDGLDINITGLTPLKTYPVTLWSWDPSSAAVPRHSTWLASDGDGPPVVKVPVYSMENPAPLNITDKRMKFDATADSSGNLLIRGIKEAGYFPAPTPPTHNVFLNGLIIGPVVTPLVVTAAGPLTGNSFPLSWASDAFATYRVERSGDALNWSAASGILSGQAGTTSFTETNILPDVTRRFYRVTRISP